MCIYTYVYVLMCVGAWVCELIWILFYGLSVCCYRGLTAVHKIGKDVIHRDVKSYNFLVDSQLNAKIADLELGIIGAEAGGHNDTGGVEDGDIESSRTMSGVSSGGAQRTSTLSAGSHLSRHSGGAVTAASTSDTANNSSNHSIRSLTNSVVGLATRGSSSILGSGGVGTKVRNANDFLANWLPPELILEPLCTYQASDTYRYVIL